MSTNTTVRKKLIEVGMPLPGIDEPCARLKQKAPKGYPTRLHKWWAQTPVSAARAVLFAQLVDDPSAWPDRFPTEEDQSRERERLFTIMVGRLDPKTERWGDGITDWATPGVPAALEAARYEIARSIAWNRGEECPTEPEKVIAYLQEHGPTVYDPFCGSGTIPLEAQRLGLRSMGTDLNPVAVLVSKTLVEIPPKFAGRPPINPEARKKFNGSASWTAKGAQGLAEDVRYYGKWMQDEARKRIGQLYPDVEVTAEAIRQQTSLAPLKGQKLPVIAWLWCRTVASPNPTVKGAHVPLISSFILSNRGGQHVWVSSAKDTGAEQGFRFEVCSGSLSKAAEAEAKNGTVTRSGGGKCILTGAAMPFAYLRSEGAAGRLGMRLMAVVAQGPKGRIYLPPSPEHESIDLGKYTYWEPEGEISHWPGRTNVVEYGMTGFRHLYTRRQLVALTSFSDLVGEARDRALNDALKTGMGAGEPLERDGCGAKSYADAVAIALAMGLSRHIQYGSVQSTWYVKDQAVKGLPQQALPMVWDFCEASPFGSSSANFESCTAIAADCVDSAPAIGRSSIKQRAAQATLAADSGGHILVSTDPPYYDNVSYADLADFFHCWLRRTLRLVMPSLTATMVTPKEDELVATPYRDRGGIDPDAFWLRGMKAALQQMRQCAAAEPTTIYYAYKQQEKKAAEEGLVSKGWTTFLQAVHDAGFVVDGTWPMRVNNPSRKIAQGTNALASAVILVCRTREAGAPITTRGAFISALKRELPAALKVLQEGNIAPVDMAQAAIGPGMAIFTRHSKVLEDDDSAMNVESAWTLINEALDNYLSEQESEYDGETRYAITWFETHGMESSAYGDAETLAKARNVSVSDVADAGLVESRGGKVRLKKRSELPGDWDPTTDKTLTVWECAQHLIRVLEGDGEAVAAALLAKLGSRADATRDLAYRLYQICERKKWAEEARAYNGLVVAWPELQKLVSQQSSAATPAPAQATLI